MMAGFYYRELRNNQVKKERIGGLSHQERRRKPRPQVWVKKRRK
jgi:hypothetical protein